MKFDLAHYVQRGHHFAIVDEVDSILIDEARTPLIISGPGRGIDRPLLRGRPHHPEADARRRDPGQRQGRGSRRAREDRRLPRRREAQDRHADRDRHGEGREDAGAPAAAGGLYDPANMPLLHHINQALRAHTLFKLDVDYMIKDGEVVIVDEFTGRLMPGRRWSDGLHQAVEAKEKVKIERENQTLATVTFQNYFRKYEKLSGMTGTADTEAEEFDKIYKLDVMVVADQPRRCAASKSPTPSTAPSARSSTRSSPTSSRSSSTGRPVLVGTVSIEKSERLSKLLKLRGIKHVVLNAKYHAQEAEIVAQAGRKGTVTIATNMAGRGTDILLGGNPEFMARQQTLADEIAERLPKGEEKFVDDEEFVYFFHLDNFYRVSAPGLRADLHGAARRRPTRSTTRSSALGGLHIIATERHEARRIDNQLRGRAGRQGDPGSSRFYLSLEDDLMRIFGSDRICRPDAAARDGGGRPDRAQDGDQGDRARAEAGRGAELLRPQAPPRIRRRDEQAAREHLRAAPGAARGQDPHHRRARAVDSREYLMTLAEELLDSTVDTYAGPEVDPEERDLRRADAGRRRDLRRRSGGARRRSTSRACAPRR